MKNNRKAAVWLVIIWVLNGCEPPVTFESPQPLTSRPVRRFPGKLIGTYESPEGTTWLILTASRIIRVAEDDIKINKNELDSTVIIRNDTLINLETKEKLKVRINGDTLIHHYQSRDTIFQISENGILKKFKGHFILNTRYSEKQWLARSLTFQHNNLLLKSISTEEDWQTLKTITGNTTDTTKIFNPTKKEFREFIKQNGFANEEVFRRIKYRE